MQHRYSRRFNYQANQGSAIGRSKVGRHLENSAGVDRGERLRLASTGLVFMSSAACECGVDPGTICVPFRQGGSCEYSTRNVSARHAFQKDMHYEKQPLTSQQLPYALYESLWARPTSSLRSREPGKNSAAHGFLAAELNGIVN